MLEVVAEIVLEVFGEIILDLFGLNEKIKEKLRKSVNLKKAAQKENCK